jgi:DNA modification methylase
MKDPNWRKCVICADSKDIIRRIPDNSVDFILTDPPYNLGQHSTGNIPLPGRSAMNNDVAEWDMLDFNPEEWADEFIRILKPTGNLFIFTSYNQLGRWYNCLDHKFDTSNFMVWHKTNPAPKIFKAGFLNSCEMIFTCWNKKHTWNFISQKEMHNFIESSICMRPERLSNPKHPAQKPVAILRKMIEIATNKNDIVFDPFMGVGSTGVAAIELDRRFIGVELDREYFEAAKNRINMTLNKCCNNKSYSTKEEFSNMVQEPSVNPQTSLLAFDGFFDCKTKTEMSVYINRSSGLAPIIKWPGGKEKELNHIIPNLPKFERYFEPFVGGGSVFMGIEAKQHFINDFSKELIQLYRYISKTDAEFFRYAEAMDRSWSNAERFFHSNQELVDVYVKYRNGQIDKESLKKHIANFCSTKKIEIESILDADFLNKNCVLVKELETNLFRKMTRMHELETQKHELPAEDLNDNIETAIKSAVYMNYRNLYNDKKIVKENPTLHCALFFFIRNYAYSGMFRYSSKGEFNVPYGGIAYNSKFLKKKLDYYKSSSLLEHFKGTQIFNLDFEEFLRKSKPTKDDFVFLDPPYDSEFSTYAQNDFTKDDQKRLANYMINECPAKWMMIIKYTDFIYNLYDKAGINIRAFEKEYLVSFMNRNDKKVKHLLITNY